MIKAFFFPLWRLVRDRFLLGRAEAIVRGYTQERQAGVRRLYDAAATRMALADESTDSWYAAAAVALYREAIPLMASALLVARDLAPPDPTLDLQAALAKMDELARTGALPPLPERYQAAKALLETPEQSRIDARGRAAVEELGQWLRRQVEPRSMRQIWIARGVRVSVTVAALVFLVSGLRR